MHSLSARLLVFVSLLLLVFFGITGLALERAFKEVGYEAMEDLLDVRVIMLLAAAEPDDDYSLALPAELPESRFFQLESGLYGRVTDTGGRELWRSPSSLGTTFDYGPAPGTGERRYLEAEASREERVLAYSYGIEWQFDDGTTVPFVFSVAESMETYWGQVSRFRRQLLTWFLALSVLLLISQAAVMRWILLPLRRAEREVAEVERGERQQLEGTYPRELSGLARNLNGLITSQHERLVRYRNALGDLAHSLKTPLAVIRNQLEDPAARRDNALLREQVSRMNDMVEYQLKRAAAAGGGGLGGDPVAVESTVEDILGALEKVHADKAPAVAAGIEPGLLFYGDQGDLLEILGNLLDNSFKWCRKQVRIEAVSLTASPGPVRRNGVRFVVEDDGPGMDVREPQRLIRRGERADSSIDGQGIGLAVVGEILASYGGELRLEGSDLGGARVTATIPPPDE